MSKFMKNQSGVRTKGMMTRTTKPDLTKKVVKTKKPVNPEEGIGGSKYTLNNIEL